MRNYFFNMILIALAIMPISAQSEGLGKEAIPEKIMAQLYKKYPTALNISAEQEKHFGQDLFEVKFKDKDGEGGENLIKFYRPNGQFFVEGVKIDTSDNANMLPPTTKDNLKAAFNNYKISEAIMIVNPNGAGEEFDLLVNSEGVDWRVLIDKNGDIASKTQN
jgi:hypothetical protein